MATPAITGIRSPSIEIGETTWCSFRSPKSQVPSLPCVGEVTLAMYWVMMSRGAPVAVVQGVGCSNGGRLLPETAVKAADHFVLPAEANQEFVEGAVEPHVVVQLERFLLGQFLMASADLHRGSWR